MLSRLAALTRIAARRRRLWLMPAVALSVAAAEAFVPGAAMAAEGSVAPQDKELPAAAIVGIVFSFLLAGVLLMIALPFILPKPPNR